MGVHDVVVAYIGPGADLGLVSYAITLGLFALTAFGAIFAWPFHAFLRWIRKGGNKSAPRIDP